MIIRKSNINDIDEILDIYSNARKYMKEHGNPNQWYDYKPIKEDIVADINNNIHYSIVENNIIYGCFTFFIGEDTTYNRIINGNWLNNKRYGVIHKLASAFIKKGILKECLDYTSKLINNIRIDTHEDNITMQNALDKYGFIKCGIIFLKDGNRRLAYHKIVE